MQSEKRSQLQRPVLEDRTFYMRMWPQTMDICPAKSWLTGLFRRWASFDIPRKWYNGIWRRESCTPWSRNGEWWSCRGPGVALRIREIGRSYHFICHNPSSVLTDWKSGLLASIKAFVSVSNWGAQPAGDHFQFFSCRVVDHTDNVILSLVCMHAILWFRSSEKLLISLLAQHQDRNIWDFWPLNSSSWLWDGNLFGLPVSVMSCLFVLLSYGIQENDVF